MAQSPYLDQNAPEILALERQKKLADLLQSRALEQPQGQMVSGRYVAPSIIQQLAPLANAYMGRKAGENYESEAGKLAQKLREQNLTESRDILETLQGKQGVVGNLPLGGTNQAIGSLEEPMGDYVAPQAALAPDKMGALMKALGSRGSIGQSLAPQLMSNMFKEDTPLVVAKGASVISPKTGKPIYENKSTEVKWNELTKYNKDTGETEIYVYDQNAPNPESTYRKMGTVKPEMTRSEIVNLSKDIATMIDNGMPVPSIMTETLNRNMPKRDGNVPTNVPTSVSTNVPSNIPSSATPTKTQTTDPFTPPPPPATLTGKDARNWKADQAKPLTGEAEKVVTGAKLYQDVLEEYQNAIKDLSPKDIANPQTRAKVQSLYSQVKLVGKNANTLGVLNGGDEKILDSLVPNFNNPQSLLLTKQTVKNIIDSQKQFGSNVILKTYDSAQKPVPPSFKKYVITKKTVDLNNPPKGVTAKEWAIMTPEEREAF
jgi:hypothetical protein